MRRQENAQIYFEKRFLSSSGRVVFSASPQRNFEVGLMTRDEFNRYMSQQQTYPVKIGSWGDRSYWMFENRFYWDNDGLTAAGVHALLVTRREQQERRVRHAQQSVAQSRTSPPQRRSAIPDDVKHYVWSRDGGRCRACGSDVELQFDHVIPVSRGGSSNAENLQVLCGPCNRRKRAGLTVT
nr:HNH endonuclease signature motif containing protein [Propioniciclava soli]